MGRGVVWPTKGRRPYNGFSCVLVNYRPMDAAKILLVRLFPSCFFAMPRKCSQYAHRWFCALFCVAKKKERKKRNKKSSRSRKLIVCLLLSSQSIALLLPWFLEFSFLFGTNPILGVFFEVTLSLSCLFSKSLFLFSGLAFFVCGDGGRGGLVLLCV